MDRGFDRDQKGLERALKTLDSHFAQSDAILQIVHNKLEHEFDKTCTGNANPLKLVARTKRLQDELPFLKEECYKLLAAKQDLIDAARTTLVKSRTLLCQLQARAGLTVASDADDPIYSSFAKTLEEWDQQFDMLSVTDSGEMARPDLNLELFRAQVLKSDESWNLHNLRRFWDLLKSVQSIFDLFNLYDGVVFKIIRLLRQSKYVADADKRREFVSGCNGSVAMCSAPSHIESHEV